MQIIFICMYVMLAFAATAEPGSITLPSTGVTICIDENGQEIPCAGTGQDGETRTGKPQPSPRFVDQGNGTVLDRMTGLQWLKNAGCTIFFEGDEGGSSRTWFGALDAARQLASGYCGLSDNSSAGDWRLPNLVEYLSLNSYINEFRFDFEIFENLNNFYWTSTPMITTMGSSSMAFWYGVRMGDFGMDTFNPGNITCTWAVKGQSSGGPAVIPLFQ